MDSLLPGPQLTEAEAAELAGPPSLLGRFGQGLANQPSEVFNQLSRLAFNLGLQDEEKPVQIPGIFDIPEPTRTAEWLTDMGATLVGMLPLAASGEAVGGLAADLLGAGRTATNVLKTVGGFEAFSEKPEDFATNALLGAAFGTAGPKVAQLFRKEKVLSPELKAVMAEASAKVEQADTKFPSKGTPAGSEALLPTVRDVGILPHDYASANKSAEVSARRILLHDPYVSKSAEESAANILAAEQGTPAAISARTFLRTNTDEALAHAESRLDTDGRLLRLRLRREAGIEPPEGSLIRTPYISEGEALTSSRVRQTLSPNEMATRATSRLLLPTAPEGSLIREPIFTEGEALTASTLRTRQANKLGLLPTEGEVATLQQEARPPIAPTPPREPIPPITPRPPAPPESVGEKAVRFRDRVFTGDTHESAMAKLEKRFPRYKEGKEKIDFGYITADSRRFVSKQEANELYKARMQQAIKEPAPPKLLQPKDIGSRIEGPALLDPTGQNILYKGKIGETHADLGARARADWKAGKLTDEQAFAIVEALDNDAQHGFHTNTGAAVDRELGATIAEVANQAPPGTKSLHSQTLRDHAALLKPKVETPSMTKAELKIPAPKKEPKHKKVATLQPEPKTGQTVKQQKRAAKKAAKAPIPSSSLEKVLVEVDGKNVEGVVLSHDAATGLSQVKVEGQVLDKWTRDLQPVEAAGGGNFVTKDATQLGGLNQFAKLEEEARQAKTGLKLKMKPGEAGFTDQDTINKIATVATAMAVGGLAGATLGEDDKKLAMAITFAVGAGVAGANLPKLIELFSQSHPKVTTAGSVPAKFKIMAQFAMQAGKNAGKVAEEASADYAGASGSAKIVRWLNRQGSADPAIIRAVDAARGEITVLTEQIEKGFNTLAQHKLSPQQKDLITKLIDGHIDYPTFDRDIGHVGIQQAVTGIHESITAMQDIFADSLAESELKNTVRNKLGKYVTEAFKLFHDPKYMPTEQQIINAATEMVYDGASLQTKMDMLRSYLHEIKVSRQLYGAKSSTGIGASFGSDILMKDDKIGPAFKAFLGIYDDPIQRLAATADKLTRASTTAEMFNKLAALEKPNGLRYVYSVEEKEAAKLVIENQIAKARGAGMVDEVATLQQKLTELDHYQYNPKNAQHGKLSDTLVDRRVFDRLKTFDSVMHANSSGMIRAMTDITNAIKLGKTVASPIQLTRQIVTMPLLGMMNKTHPGDWKRAYDAIYNNPALRERLTRIGLMSGDSIRGMLQEDFSAMLKGRLDQMITNRAFKTGWKNWQELYRAPDLIVRVAGFLKEEQRLLSKYGTNFAERAEKEAIDFANRYSMNYGAVPPIVKTLRRLPFVNQFLTFAYETARITKNLGVDAVVHKDPYAIGVLTAFATGPFVLQRISESQLSPEDKKQWDMVKGLGPSYSRSNFKLVTGKDRQGNFHYIDFTPLLLHDKWLKIGRDIGAKDTSAFFADNPVFGWQNTPLLNIAANLITGTDIHTKKKLDTVGRTLDSIRRDVMPPLLGTDLDKLVAALTPNAEGGLGIRDMQTGQANTIGGILGSYATSLRPYTVAPSYLIQRAITDAQEQTANARAYLYRVSRSNATLQQKAAALAEYQQVQKQVIMALRDKLRVSTPSQESSAQ